MARAKLLIFVFTLLNVNFTAFAAVDNSVESVQNITTGKSYIIPSKILNQAQNISVALPQGYENSGLLAANLEQTLAGL